MIPIPNLPTDSLYKFLFVGGIVLLIASQFFLSQGSEPLENTLFKLDSIYLVDSIEYNFYKDSLKNKSSDNIIYYENFKKNRKPAFTDRVILTKKLETYVQDLELELKDYYLLKVISWLSIVGGMIGWSIFVQIPQDRMTKIQLELMEMELKKAKEHSQVTIKYHKSNPPFYKR